MSNALKVKVTSRKDSAGEWWEGTVSLDGAKATKLSRKADDSTRFTTRASVQGAAKRFAERYGYNDVDYGTEKTVAKPAVIKKAAKKSVKNSTPASSTPTA